MKKTLVISSSFLLFNSRLDKGLLKVANARDACGIFDLHKEKISTIIIDSNVSWWGGFRRQPGCARFFQHLSRRINMTGQKIKIIAICSDKKCTRCGCNYVRDVRI